jgi:hypothetical protein
MEIMKGFFSPFFRFFFDAMKTIVFKIYAFLAKYSIMGTEYKSFDTGNLAQCGECLPKGC